MTDFYRMELKGLDRLTAAMEKAPALVDRELQIFFHSIVRHLETEVVERTPEVTGDLRRSIMGEVRLWGIRCSADRQWRIGEHSNQGRNSRRYWHES